MNGTYAMEDSQAITNNMMVMFKHLDESKMEMAGIVKVAGTIGQAWGICKECWKVGPMTMACREDNCISTRNQF